MPQNTFVVGTRVQYKCKSRFYRLYGSEYQTCLSSRTWSGYQPACVPGAYSFDLTSTAVKLIFAHQHSTKFLIYYESALERKYINRLISIQTRLLPNVLEHF